MKRREAMRRRVWEKFNGHCAYCGRKLKYKEMQIDHMYPRTYGGNSEYINLMPSCRRCNHYKRDLTLKGFRRLMNTLHERIESQYIVKVAMDYGIAKIKPFTGSFYFEQFVEINYEQIDLLKLLNNKTGRRIKCQKDSQEETEAAAEREATGAGVVAKPPEQPDREVTGNK